MPQTRSLIFCTLNSPYLLKSYLNERQFETKINGETSSRFHIHSGVPKGSILGPLIYVLYASDLPTSRETTLGTFADNTAIFATHEDPTMASLNLQEHLHIIEKWLKKWNINPYPTAFPYGNGMVLHFYQQQESSTTKTVHKVINKGLKTYV